MPRHTITSELEALLAAIQSGTYIGPGSETLTANRLLPVAFQQHDTLPDVTGFVPGQMVAVPEDGLYVAVGKPGAANRVDFTGLDPATAVASVPASPALDFQTNGGFDGPDIDDQGITPGVDSFYGVFRGQWHFPALTGKVAVVVRGYADASQAGFLTVGFTGMQDGNGAGGLVQVQDGGRNVRFLNASGAPFAATQGSGANSTPPFGQPQELVSDAPSSNGESGTWTLVLLIDPDNHQMVATYDGVFGPIPALTLTKNASGQADVNGAGGSAEPGGDLEIQLDGRNGHIHIASITVAGVGTQRWNKTVLVAA